VIDAIVPDEGVVRSATLISLATQVPYRVLVLVRAACSSSSMLLTPLSLADTRPPTSGAQAHGGLDSVWLGRMRVSWWYQQGCVAVATSFTLWDFLSFGC
jgi:hypothetical protein